MKVEINLKVWDDKDSVYCQQLGMTIPELNNSSNLLGSASTQLLYTMNRVIETQMLMKLTIDELNKMSQVINEVRCEKIAEKTGKTFNKELHDKSIQSKFPAFKSYGLTREQVYEVTSNYIGHHCKLNQEMIQEAGNDSLTFKTVGPYLKDAETLLKFKEMNDGLLYHRFID